MSCDVSACAVFGVLINEEMGRRMGNPWEAFLEAIKKSEESPDDAAEPHTHNIIKVLDGIGICVPEESHLFHTGTDDERPGRTETDAGQWIIGIGLLNKPWQFPRCYASFQDLAKWHTWVVGG